MANLKNTTINDSGFLGLPSGTAAQRPASPTTANLRFNSTQREIETFYNSRWNTVARDSDTVVTSGLQLYLDANNINSNTGSGSTWFDISGNSRNGTIRGALFVNDGDLKYLRFTQQSHEVTFSSFVIAGTKTLSFWLRTNRPISDQDNWQIGFLEGGANGSQFGMMFGVGQTQDLGFWGFGSPYDFSITSPTTRWIDLDRWVFVTVTWDSARNIRVYKNGLLHQTLYRNSDAALSAKFAMVTDTTVPFRINSMGVWNSGFTYLDLAKVMVYNRQLSDDEIFQNFEVDAKKFNPAFNRLLGRNSSNPAPTAKSIKLNYPDSPDGLYWLQPPGSTAARQYYCDMTTQGGGWMMIARTHPAGSASAWGWKGAAFGSVTDFSQPYNAGWGTLWHNTGNVFSNFMMGNRKNINTNEWGPFIYYTDLNYNTLFTVDNALELGNRFAVNTDLNIWNQSNYPVMQCIIGWADTGNNVVYFMRDAAGYTGTSYGITPAGMGTTYCNTTVLGYSGPWCSGNATVTGGDFVQKTGVQDHGGTNQCMLMVR